MIKFLDTCACLELQEQAFDSMFYISNITLNELEGIKTSGVKDEEIKYKARRFLGLLSTNEDKYKVIIYQTCLDEFINNFGLPITNDSKIIITAYSEKENNILFETADFACYELAKFVGSECNLITKEEDNYRGYEERILHNDAEIAEFYQHMSSFRDDTLYNNEYLLLCDEHGNISDKYCYTKYGLREIPYPVFESELFGKIKPKDDYQACLMDSFKNNTITLAGGPAGSGKTFLALAYLFQELERGRIDRIVLFCNPVVARNACKLGFYPGTKDEKLLSTQVGNVLTSKIGYDMVKKLIDEEDLILIPVGDARGYEVPPHSGVYVLESQNLTVDLLKLILQRIGEESKVIVDGDRFTQLDMAIYSGSNNGMMIMSKTFRGENCFGQVDLKNIYRSEIANIADRM